MRFILSVVVLSVISLFAQAQTVEKISGAEATVLIQGSESLQAGDKVSFLNEHLDVSGQGEVTKVSEGGKRALVKIISGTAKKGMSLEKNSPKPVSIDSRPSSPPIYLDEEDRRILRIGEISQAQYVFGGIIGTYPVGFGVGHAIQGRYSDKGWIFTVGEIGSIVVLMSGVGDCMSSISNRYDGCNGGLLFLGAAGFVGFRIWEIVDVWAAPPEINRRYRELKQRMPPGVSVRPLLGPTKDGAVAGIRVIF